jgi:hypothetical protein
MEMEQMMACLLAEISTNREEMRANQQLLKEEMLAKMEAKAYDNLKKIKESIKTNQATARLRQIKVEMMAKMDSQLEKMEACLGKMEAIDLEANPEGMESKAVHEISKKEDTVQTVRALRKWYGDWNLAIGGRGKLKKRTQGNGGSKKKLAAACRGMKHCAIPAWHKGHSGQEPGRDNVARGTPKGQVL